MNKPPAVWPFKYWNGKLIKPKRKKFDPSKFEPAPF